MRKTLFQDWVTDFRKILFCIGVLALGTLFNAEEPKALAIAVIVQGISNIDSFWDFLKEHKIYLALKIMTAILILLSTLGAVLGIYSLWSPKELFNPEENEKASIFICLVILFVAFPIIVLISDIVFNAKKEMSGSIGNMDGGEEVEI